ncbi:MAG: D-2-hydroxyacid dehydrogenase [Eubacterium sp.]|nr:D-2-hydroxyacid dehydrogenase [Eubacterium sp.]
MRAVILEAHAVNPGDVSWDPVTSLIPTDIYENTTEDEKWNRIKGHELVLTNKVKIDEEVFSRFPEIRYVGVCATGYNVVDLEAAKRRGIIVTNIPAYSTDSVVQCTWALILELTSHVAMHAESVRRGDWIKSPTFCYWLTAPTELSGKTIGIYGFGNIGRGVAKVAEAFGMQVLVHTAHPEKYEAAASSAIHFVDEEELFRSSDILTFHCPLTEETNGLVNQQTISRMKDGVILINVSRGPIINEADLAVALKSKKISGAGLDVISVEPMLPDNPLINAPNLIITPHIAWASVEARTRLIAIAADNIRAFLNGDALNRVN